MIPSEKLQIHPDSKHAFHIPGLGWYGGFPAEWCEFFANAPAEIARLQQRVEALSRLLADAQHPAGMPNEGDIQYWYEEREAVLRGGETG